MEKPKCILTVDAEALPMRAPHDHVEKLIMGRYKSGDLYDGEWGIGRMMDIADKHNVQMTFFLDFAETELYGEEVINVGKYIVSRGHDLQVHCHYTFLERKIRECFPYAGKSYYAWYEDEEISSYMIDYCLEQYHKCIKEKGNFIIFRGGEYRFDKAILKKLKEKGVAADSSYHYMRPFKKPVQKQFFFENGLLELPVGIVPEWNKVPEKSLNFNEPYLYPEKRDDIAICLNEYETILHSFYNCYGSDALAVMLMHSWSFCFEKKRFQETGYIDRPNPYAAELFDCFLTYFKDKVDFICAGKAIEGHLSEHIDVVKFEEVFERPKQMELKNELEHLEELVRKKAGGRKIVIWGNGWIEARIMRIRDMQLLLNVPFYISRDGGKGKTWRGKPVKTFEESQLNPEKYYVLLIANTCFPEIRDNLQKAGFKENLDYYDAARFLLNKLL